MPWMERDTVSLRREFVELALREGANKRELCRRFRINPHTGYKWIRRYHVSGIQSLRDRSRRPKGSPGRTPPLMEDLALAVREAHPAWGGRKIRKRLQVLGFEYAPAPSTITGILRRHGRLEPVEAAKHKPFVRFEHKAPNDLWQMDFKGPVSLWKGRCHPLTLLDDHSRFSLGLFACANRRRETVQQCVTQVFRHYGLPFSLLVDNGAPWGVDATHVHTSLTAWLIRLRVRIIHSRPYHPQTLGKDERFHRTLEAEVLRFEQFHNLGHCQHRFDRWREVYNFERPHEALDMQVPATRYRESPRSFPESLPPIEYGPQDIVRKVCPGGRISFRYRRFRVGRAFLGFPVALRATGKDGSFDVFFCHQRIAKIDLRSPDA